MSLQNIFEMAKADRYAADGREELDKAREADVEDRTYQIGEISAKTGLQKTANGWVKPKSGGAAKSGSSGANNETGNADIKKFDTTKLEKMKTDFEEYKKAGRIVPEGAEERYEAVKSELEKRNGGASGKHPVAKFDEYGLPSKETIAMKDKFLQEEEVSNPEKLTNAEFNTLAEKLDKKLGINNKERAQELLVAKDSAPRVLTGDCKVRVKK